LANETQRKVLVVEDSTTMRHLLAMSVRRLGAEVFEAGDGLEALRLLSQMRFDLIFVDINMPVMDGLKLIRLVREGTLSTTTPICVCTTEDSHKAELQARTLGANYFLRKPTRRQEVEAVLADVFKL
jgi:two-component system chemotaxis response regulator CheY